MPYAIVEGACPNCGGFIDTEHLIEGLPCSLCLNGLNLKNQKLSEKTIYNYLLSRRKLYGYKKIVELQKELYEFERFFKKISNKPPWSAQKTWAKRLLKGESFAIIAPTGVGKTTFSIIYSIYHVIKGKGRTYIIVPTKNLQEQITSKVLECLSKLKDHSVKVCSPGVINDEYLELGNFNLLITTSAYLSRNFSKISAYRFSLVIVDDVDALLRNSKNIERILMLIGFSREILEVTYKLIVAKIDLFKLVASGADSEKIEKIKNKIGEYRKLIDEYIKQTKLGQILVCSATGRNKGLKAKMFKELLNFEAGTVIEYMRNIVDTYDVMNENYVSQVISLIRKLGSGGLVFVSQDLGIKKAKALVKELKNHGIKAELATSSKHRYLQKFAKGEIDILVGIASYYGVIVRGIDLPERIRYAVFLGVPKFQIELEKGLNNPVKILALLTVLEETVETEDELAYLKKTINILSKILDRVSFKELKILRKALSEEMELEGFLGKLQKLLLDAKQYILNKISEPRIKEKIKNSDYIILREFKGKTYIVTPDIMTYIQASGRTSRMFANGMTKGLSIILVDDEKVFERLTKQLKYYVENFEIKPLSSINLDKVLAEIDRDREVVREILRGEVETSYRDPIIPALFIVESPTKARTIAYFFGKPSKRRINGIIAYEVLVGDPRLGTKDYMLTIVATRGHILDLTTSPTMGYYGVLVDSNNVTPIYTTIKKCRGCGHQFTEPITSCPKCGSTRIYDSKSVIEVLRALAQEVETVFIGTDPDSEGEKIAWDVYVLLRPYIKRIYRVEFHEITRNAIIKALASPRRIKEPLVEAQVVRRVEDRWIGFELSRRLWSVFGKHWLSAGRVQTPVLGWIIKQHKKWKEEREKYAIISVDNILKLEIPLSELKVEKPEEKVALEIVDKGVEEVTISPPPPFTTDTMLTEASRELRLGANEIMQLAQDLFEQGFITYHRTDSVRVSTFGQYVAKAYLEDTFGAESSKLYKPRSWGVGGAHECIRPTRPIDAERLLKLINEGIITPIKPLTKNHIKLYDLIFKRFIASQMVEAKVIKQKVEVNVLGVKKELERIVGIVEPGFLEIYPIIQVEKKLDTGKYYSKVEIIEKPKVHLFTQGDVVKLMKERGIGRPSTYAKIIQTLLQRNYVIESKKTKKLIPTDLGVKVYTYLSRNYFQLISEERTAMLEKIMDEIEEGKRNYVDVLDELYEEIKSIP